VFLSQQPPPHPPPILVNGEPKFEVEQILDERCRCRMLQYLVCWKGYGQEHDTWEVASNLENVVEAVWDFHEHGPDAPVSAMKIRATAFKVFDSHPHLFNPLMGSAGEGFTLPNWHHSQHDWMLTVSLEFVDQMVEGLQDGWQDQVLGGVDRVWLAEPADTFSGRKEWKVEYAIILGWDNSPVQLYWMMNPT
jgi:hypothetical protein